MEKATCYIVDDEILAIERLERLLKLNGQVHVIGHNTSSSNAIDEIDKLWPDLLFLDVEMPTLSGFELIESIRRLGLNPTFVMVTAFDQYAIKALRAEALDYLVKPVDLEDLNQTINRFLQKREHSISIPSGWELSDREKQVLCLLVQGLSSKEIAETIYLSRHTIDTYRRNILEKSKCKSTSELVGKLS